MTYIVDVPPLSKEDFVDHQIISSKMECIELFQVQPFVSNTFH